MRKSSRLWWLHGAILVTAVMGCKGSGSCGCNSGTAGAPITTGAPVGGPVLNGGATAYSQSPTTTFSGASSMPAGSSFQGAGGAYPAMPSMSSGVSPSMSPSPSAGVGGLR